MRADRLISLLMFVQSRTVVTAAEVAAEFEISTRTARRDLEALAMSGVPLYSQAGRGGGWRLVGGARTNLSGLSSDEARALFLAFGHQGETNPLLAAALRKLVVALPEQFRGDALAATTAIRVDPSGWGQIGPAPRPPFVDLLSDAVIRARQATIRYTAPGKEPADRVVHPLGLVTKRGVWYLIANTSNGIRTFRLSRIAEAQLLDEPVDRPADFDLDATWEDIVTHVEQQRTGVSVRVAVAAASAANVKFVFGDRCTVVHGSGPVGRRVEMQITEASVEALAAQLAGFGARITLLEAPLEVEREMTRIASDLAHTWLRQPAATTT